MTQSKTDAAKVKFAESSAELISKFVEYAGDDKTAIKAFCNTFDETLGNLKERKKAREIFEKLQQEISLDKEGQKSGDSGPARSSPGSSGDRKRQVSASNDKSIFGSQKGSKTFVVDEMLATGKYTVDQIIKESNASKNTIEKRIRALKKLGYECTESKNKKIGVGTSMT